MRPFAFILASLLLFGSISDASATTPSTTIAMGCGVGHTRDPAGHCRRKFNLFRHHGQFQAFKRRHCTKIQTPDGRVDRCQI